MRISILIVTRKWCHGEHTFDHINELKHSNIDFEVLVAEGNNPSSQRNLLAQRAEGDFILFLDDDSIPATDLLEIYYEAIRIHPDTAIMGGPSILTGKENFLYQLSSIFFSSVFGIGPIRSRYNSIGPMRKATEKDLILCNLLMEKDFFLKTKGFNRNIYPGEENEFLKGLGSSTNVIYNPKAIVYRAPRESFYLFLKQMFSYGRGRVKHLRLNDLFEYVFLIPLLFSLYVLSLPLLGQYSKIFYTPTLVHISLALLTSVTGRGVKLDFIQKLASPFFFFLGHFSYGLGGMFGLGKYKIFKKFTKKTRHLENIQIHKLKSFKKNYT